MMKNVMRRVYPMIGLEVEDKDLAKKMKNLDPSNTFDAGFLKDLADETRDVLGLDFVFCFIAFFFCLDGRKNAVLEKVDSRIGPFCAGENLIRMGRNHKGFVVFSRLVADNPNLDFVGTGILVDKNKFYF